MIRRLAISVFLATLIASVGTARAVTLVNPDGTPVGGQWQKWVDEMRVPTISGTLTFITYDPGDPNPCGTAEGCSGGSFPGWIGISETWVESDINARSTLYFELGHQFDWAVLSYRERNYLAREWQHPHARWWDTERAKGFGIEDGLEGDFAQIYGDCAVGINDRHSNIASTRYDGVYAPGVTPKINACLTIDRAAHAAGADMELTRLAPWNRPQTIV